MFELFEQAFQRLSAVWDDMSINQRVLSGALIAALVMTSLYVTTLGDRLTPYTVLFAQLDPKSANDIASRLDQNRTPYRLTQNGTAIEVPSSQADRLKIEMTAEGLQGSGVVGYEILDTTNFGMSDFLQKVNYRRAMEGELSKTLGMLDEVEEASVRLVIPERSLFTEEDDRPSASVVLRLKRGRSLPQRSVEAIANLIASAAVEGFDPSDVTIVDTRGTLLTSPQQDDEATRSSTLMDLKFAYERVLAGKVKGMLDGAFGAGVALVNVNADMDFDRLERSSTSFSQENSAIVSEERSEETNPTADGGGSETTTTNYDTGRIVENLVRSPGSTVRRVTVSVMIDSRSESTVDENGDVQSEKIPWSDVQLASIRAITEAAIGYDDTRGDVVVVENMDFGTREASVTIESRSLGTAISEIVRSLTMALTIVVALGLFFLILRSMVGALDPSKMKMAAEQEFVRFKPEIEVEEEVKTERGELIKKILTKTVKDPEIAAKTLRSIYRGEE